MITLIVVLTTVAAALLLVGAAVYARVRRVRRKRDAEASERGGKHVRAAPAAVLLHAGMACRRSCSAEQCMSGQQGRAPPRSRACCLCPGARRTARAPRQHGGRPNLTLTHVRAARGRTRCCRPARSACRRSWWTARRSRACPATRAARRAAARATRRACTPTARLARRAAAAPGSGPDFMMRSVMSLPDTLRMRSQARGAPPWKLPACACCGAGRAGRAPEVSHPALCARASTAAALPHPNPAARRARQELLAELEIGQPLGRGSYGRVYRGARRPNAPPAAPPLRPVRAAPVARPSRLRRLRAPLGRPGSWCCAAAVQGAGWCMHVPSSSIWEGADGGPDGGPAGEDWGQP